MIKIIYFINEILSNFYSIFFIQSIALCIKTYLLWVVIVPGWRKEGIQKSLLFLMGLLIGSMAVDATWILWFAHKLFFPEIGYSLVLFFIRLSWALVVVQYQSLSLFLDSLFEFDYKISRYQKFFLSISSFFTIYFVYSAITNVFLGYRTPLEYSIVKASSFYLLGPLMMITLFICTHKLMLYNLPKILRKQIKLIIKYLIVPFVFADVIQLLPFSIMTSQGTGNFSTIVLSSFLITYAMFFSCRKIMGLRFLNLEDSVRTNKKFIFINDFKLVLEQMSAVVHFHELKHISSAFFGECFETPFNSVKLHARYNGNDEKFSDHEHIDNIERFLSAEDDETLQILNLLREKKIWIYDEIHFSDFYHQTASNQRILSFMDTIHVDIFLPIFQNNVVIGALTVARNARQDNFYNNIETDQMVVFAGYLAYIINLLQNYTVDQLLIDKKALKEQLYKKHTQIAHYQESMRTVIRQADEKIGVIYYKGGKFIYGNTYAHELLSIPLNNNDSHPTINNLKKLVKVVERYKASDSMILSGKDSRKIMCMCMPDSLDDKLLLMIHPLGVSEILKEKIAYLPEETEWDYLYYLETTQSGVLINQLIPGGNNQLLKFKIELIKVALSIKAIFLDVPQDDLSDVAQIIHDISLRQKIFTITLTPHCDEVDLSVKLFGINSLYGSESLGLLSKLGTRGTLLIKNIEFLPLSIQNILSEYIQYGYYRVYKSEKKIEANVRILCSTSHGLNNLVRENKITNSFFNVLQHTRLLFPSLLTLPDKEMRDLGIAVARQVDHSFAITHDELNLLQSKGITSLSSLRNHIQHFIEVQANQRINDEWRSVDAVIDEDVKKAMKLGKTALKDKELMKKLLQKFKNQNQLALLLGVDRSSIYRRVKQHQLGG